MKQENIPEVQKKDGKNDTLHCRGQRWQMRQTDARPENKCRLGIPSRQIPRQEVAVLTRLGLPPGGSSCQARLAALVWGDYQSGPQSQHFERGGIPMF